MQPGSWDGRILTWPPIRYVEDQRILYTYSIGTNLRAHLKLLLCCNFSS